MKSYTFADLWHDLLKALRRAGLGERVVEVQVHSPFVPDVPLPVRPEIIVRLPSDPKPIQKHKRAKAKRGPGLRSKVDRKHPRRTD